MAVRSWWCDSACGRAARSCPQQRGWSEAVERNVRARTAPCHRGSQVSAHTATTAGARVSAQDRGPVASPSAPPVRGGVPPVASTTIGYDLARRLKPLRIRSYAHPMKPGDIPYRWFWILGGVLLVCSLWGALQGYVLMSIGAGLGSVMMIVLGLVERHRGAPPI